MVLLYIIHTVLICTNILPIDNNDSYVKNKINMKNEYYNCA